MAPKLNSSKKTYLTLNHDTKIDLGRFGNRGDTWDEILYRIMTNLESCERWKKEIMQHVTIISAYSVHKSDKECICND